MFQVLIRYLRIEGFLSGHYDAKRTQYFEELRRLYAAGAIVHREHLAVGLDKVPAQLELLFNGTNHGKLIVKMSAE